MTIRNGDRLSGLPYMKRLLSFILLTFSLSSTAQFHTIFHFSVPEGLPSSEVYEVFQDRKGFLWFATDNGVARYDGKAFVSYHVKDGLTDPVVFGFLEDDQGRIWLRTFSGRLCYIEDRDIKTYPYNSQLIKTGEYPFFNYLYDSKADELWFTLANVYGRIDKHGQAHTQEAPPRSTFIKVIGDRLLQGTDIRSSVQRIIINDRIFPIELTDTTEYKFFNAIAIDDRVYVSIYKDLFEYKDDRVTRIVTAGQPIISLSADLDKHLWIGYLNAGIERYIDSNTRTSPEFLKDKSVTKVLHEASSGYWFSTLESGVYHVPTFEIENYILPTASRIKTVLSLTDTVLAGDQAGNLFFFTADTRKISGKKTYKDEVYALFRDDLNNVWVSAGMDIIRYGPGFSIKNQHRNIIATLFSRGPDQSVWSYGGIRITHFNKDGRVIDWLTRSINYRAMLVDDSIIYLAGRTGLHLRDTTMRLIHSPPHFEKFKITQIEPINDSTLVLATQGNGLLLYNKSSGKYRQFDTRHAFLANNIYCLAKTGSHLWMGTEKGLVALNIARMLEGEVDYYQMSGRSGLVSDKINLILPVKGSVWAFADNGFSVIPESITKSPLSQPVFYWKHIIAGTDTLSPDPAMGPGLIRLPYNKNHLTYTFGFISFSNQDIFLRYRISDESDWTATTERSLQFLSLAPGDYHFELQSSLDNIHWNAHFEPLPFTIDSPWWMKWYTIMGALIFILLLGYLYFRYRQSIYQQRTHYLSIINTHQQKLIQSEIETLERERKRIARELHDGVGTNLTAIKLMVSQLLQNHRDPQAAEIEEQFQIALRELKDIIYGLTPPSLGRYGLFTAMKNYVSKLNKSLTPDISLQIFGREIKNYEFNIMVFRIVQELISNSIKHSSAKHITIHINSFDDMLNIVYEDDGIGFSQDTFRGGLGLDNIESRIHSMSGSLKFESGAHGVSYTIDIPLKSIRETV